MNIHARLFLSVIFFCISLTSCQRENKSNYQGPVIALVVKTLNHPFFIDMENGAKVAAEEAGIQLIVQGPEREIDVEKQMQIIENLIQRKVDAICVAPCGSREIIPAIVKANHAKIPVLTVDTRVDTLLLKSSKGFVYTYIGSDNYRGGKIAGEYIASQLNGKGKIAILEGIPGHETGDARRQGFLDVINQNPGVQVVSSLTANWERDQGFNVFQNILQANPDIEALFACNDLMALGAVEAIDLTGKTGEILVVGFDALDDGLAAVKKGKMHGTIAQFPYEMGKLAVENAIKVLNGAVIPGYIPVKIQLITRESDSFKPE